MKATVKDKILKMHADGKNYGQIQRELKCSKGTIAYHLGAGQKEKTRERSKIWKAKKRKERAELKNRK